MSEWIKVEDKLPKENNHYLTYVVDNGCNYFIKIQRFYENPRELKGMYKDSFTNWEFTTWDDNIVTHWMRLPSIPKDAVV